MSLSGIRTSCSLSFRSSLIPRQSTGDAHTESKRSVTLNIFAGQSLSWRHVLFRLTCRLFHLCTASVEGSSRREGDWALGTWRLKDRTEDRNTESRSDVYSSNSFDPNQQRQSSSTRLFLSGAQCLQILVPFTPSQFQDAVVEYFVETSLNSVSLNLYCIKFRQRWILKF